MMINSINNISFKSNKTVDGVKDKVTQAKVTRDNLLEGTIGAGGAVAVTRGGYYLKTAKIITKKASPAVSSVPKNFQRFKKFLSFEGLKNAKILKPLMKLAGTKLGKTLIAATSGVTAAAVCIGDLAHTATTLPQLFRKPE